MLQKFPNRRLHLSLSFFPKRKRARLRLEPCPSVRPSVCPSALATFRLGKVKVLSLPPATVAGRPFCDDRPATRWPMPLCCCCCMTAWMDSRHGRGRQLPYIAEHVCYTRYATISALWAKDDDVGGCRWLCQSFLPKFFKGSIFWILVLPLPARHQPFCNLL